jgi:hypothetical protein
LRTPFLPNWTIGLLFVLSGAVHPVRQAGWTVDEILSAVRFVETGGAPDEGRCAVGDGGRAIGPFQIHRAYWQDAGLPGAFEDCRDPEYARAVVLAYWRRYCPRALDDLDAEALARVHNGGPTGDRRESTRGFWRKVEGVLEASRGTP